MPTDAAGGRGRNDATRPAAATRGVAAGRLDDRPPFFRSWAGVYGVVLGFLAFLVLVFHLLTRWLA